MSSSEGCPYREIPLTNSLSYILTHTFLLSFLSSALAFLTASQLSSIDLTPIYELVEVNHMLLLLLLLFIIMYIYIYISYIIQDIVAQADETPTSLYVSLLLFVCWLYCLNDY